MIIEPSTRELFDTYCKASGLQLELNMARNHALQRFQMRFTRADLVLVIGYLRKEVARGDRKEGALKFSNLVDADNGFERFEEDLALARKTNRVRPPQKIGSVTQGDITRAVIHDPAAESEPVLVRSVLAEQFSELSKKLREEGSQ